MDGHTWVWRQRRFRSPSLDKARDERRRRRSTTRWDAHDWIAENRAERRRVSAAVRAIAAYDCSEGIDERIEARIACARQVRRGRSWKDLQTRRQRWLHHDRWRIAGVGMRWFYFRSRARARSPERFSDESLARHARSLIRTQGRLSLPLALRWERWLSSDLEFPSERLAFCGGVASCNEVVARMLSTRPELRAELGAWIARTRASASPEALQEAQWIKRLQGVW